MHSKGSTVLLKLIICIFFNTKKGNKPGVLKTMLHGNKDPTETCLRILIPKLHVKTAFTSPPC